MTTMQVTIPDIGDFDEVAVIELQVKVGDKVRAEQSLITVESDKASMEIPSSHAGEITAMSVKLGDKVKKGSVILTLETASASGLAVTESVIATAAPSGLAVTESVIASEAKQSTGAPRRLGLASMFAQRRLRPTCDSRPAKQEKISNAPLRQFASLRSQ